MRKTSLLKRLNKCTVKGHLLSFKLLFILFIILLQSVPGSAQDLLTGSVKNPQGFGIAGVTVRLKGYAAATVTDNNGFYKMNKIQGADTLVFSYVGYITQEVAIHSRTLINVQLTDDPKLLDDIVIIGYGSQKKVNLTGAVDQIGSQYFENRPVPNVGRALEGVVPNLNIAYTSGRPTSSPQWNVRGAYFYWCRGRSVDFNRWCSG